MHPIRWTLLALLLALTGCLRTRPVPAPGPGVPAGFPNHAAAEILAFIEPVPDTLHAFRARASFAVESPERSGRFSAEIQDRRGDSLYMSISPGLGIEAARILVTQDSIFLYDRIQNRLNYGSLEEAGDLLALPVTGEDLFRNLLGLLTPSREEPWEVEADEAYYYLVSDDATRRYTIDPAVWRVTRYEERTFAGELIEERSFSEFDVFEGVTLPRRIVFNRPRERSMASLFYRSLELNPERLSFDLRVSSSAERVKVGGAR